MPESLEEIMKRSGCCERCDGCFECDCTKNLMNGPKGLQVDTVQIDYDLNLASGD